MSESPCDIGLIGLAVMGKNLVLNMEDHGYSVAVFNRTTARVDEFIAENPGRKLVGTHSIEELCKNLKRPRKIVLLVKAGQPVDDFIEMIIPHLEPDDIIIDAGNSHFPDTIRRTADIETRGYRFIGTGVSGGEEGARFGPSIMPGGSISAWPQVKDVFQAISAKVGDNEACCEWVGNDGAGHYVKMVHNGIEYGDMQLICEAYFLMKESLGMSAKEMYEVFARWNEGKLSSYLIEITRDILAINDEKTGNPLVEMILDTAGQKGTGRWTSASAIDLGVPAPTIVEAVLARAISAQKDERVNASKALEGPSSTQYDGDREKLIDAIENALYCSKICSYAQGYALIQAAADEYKWDLDYGSIALMWRGGCIIRAVFLEDIRDAFAKNPKLENLLLDPFFKDAVHANQSAWREVVSEAIKLGIPTPAFSSALAYYDSYRRDVLPANLLQAQRDYFGSHTYIRIDDLEGGPVHTDWVGITKAKRGE